MPSSLHRPSVWSPRSLSTPQCRRSSFSSPASLAAVDPRCPDSIAPPSSRRRSLAVRSMSCLNRDSSLSSPAATRATIIKDQLLGVGLACGLLWGAIHLVGAVWIKLKRNKNLSMFA
ncbi:hypothetical protein E2562_025826 [Oryza meyeriana var. granulata]|uniref:Uncharacterized protein n=1 Tax=Oryza meyeriana var. granulata TaxID=110450 RepID=A0A6G1E1N6_9ORYZ|nr:hypothetical protein E2562_025826 [Oryza meyeriana var. granulata]